MSDLKIFTQNIEEKAQNQVQELIDQPAFASAKVRIMPDVHAGAGCVIGFTADLGDKVIPNIVGVDIGCGVHVIEFPKGSKIDYEALDNFIKTKIPAGFTVNGTVAVPFDLKQLYCYDELEKVNRLELGIGSLGGGNHFIEIDKDDEDRLYLVIHTGSRNLGKQVACIYQDKAVEHCHDIIKTEVNDVIAKLKAENRQTEIEGAIAAIHDKYKTYAIPKDLCFLEGEGREAYLHDMKLCQEYAILNRQEIADRIVNFLGLEKVSEFESVHNYIDNENMVRKGAIAAHKGQKVIIPLNMRDGSIIGIGKGNPDWNESAPHGAGRLLARGEAKRTLELSDFTEAMKGIYTTTVDMSTIDESPMVYKNAQEIIDAIGDTVEITRLIKPTYNFKAGDD